MSMLVSHSKSLAVKQVCHMGVPFLFAALTRGMLLFDRHIEKNGGGSFSSSMRKSNCTVFGYGIYRVTWKRINSTLHNESLVCVDGHSPVADDWLNKTKSISSDSITVLRIRRPDQHYKSFYTWGVPRRYEFVSWMPDNLQTNILIHSHRAILAARNVSIPRVNVNQCDDVIRDVLGRVDFLYTVENMDCVWDTLRQRTGLALPRFQISERPRFSTPPKLPNTSILMDLTRKHAWCDWKLYTTAEKHGCLKKQ